MRGSTNSMRRVLAVGGEIRFQDSGGSRVDARIHDAGTQCVAHIHNNGDSSLALEPFVETSITSTVPSPRSEVDVNDRVILPASTEAVKCFIYLRLQDMVHFEASQLHFEVTRELLLDIDSKSRLKDTARQSRPLISVDDVKQDVLSGEVQVRSSDIERDESDDESKPYRSIGPIDLDGSKGIDITPSKDRREEVDSVSHSERNGSPRRLSLSVMETPSKSLIQSEEAVFSTAPDVPDEDLAHRHGRSVQIIVDKEDSSDSKITPTKQLRAETSLVEDDSQPIFTLRARKTYSSRKQRQKPLKVRKSNVACLEDESEDDDEAGDEHSKDIPESKIWLNQSKSAKRESPDSPSDDDGTAIRVASKRRRITPQSSAPQSDPIDAAHQRQSLQTRAELFPSSPQEQTQHSQSATIDIALDQHSTTVRNLLFSNTTANKSLVKWLRTHDMQVIEDAIEDTTFVCVVPSGNLRKTLKVMKSLVLGQLVVTDDWLAKSKRADKLLDPAAFVHHDLSHCCGSHRRGLFSGKHLVFTQALIEQYQMEAWTEIQTIVTYAGAISIRTYRASNRSLIHGADATDLVAFGAVLGSERFDDDAVSLVRDYNLPVFHKDLLSHSIITGHLDLDRVKFALDVPATSERKRRGR